MDEAASIRTAVHFEAMDTFIVTDTCPAILYGVNGCRVHTNVYIDEGYLHDDSPNNPNVTKKNTICWSLYTLALSCVAYCQKS